MSDAVLEHDGSRTFAPGTRVEVRSRFTARWTRGFEVAAAQTGGYVLRRLSDGAVLPTSFDADEVRPERVLGALEL